MVQFNAPVQQARALLIAGRTDSALKTIEDALLSTILDRHRVPTEVSIVHYTSIHVLKSIIDRLQDDDQASVRAYDSIHLNDPSEGTYLRSCCSSRHSWISGDESTRHAYVTSLIVNESGDMHDNLIFWQGYGSQGEGCSLAFPRETPRSNLWRVLYGETAAGITCSIFTQAVSVFAPLIRTVRPPMSIALKNQLKELFKRVFDRIRYLYKSEAYEHENECRFVSTANEVQTDEVCFEYSERGDGSPRIRHYIEPETLDIQKNLLISGSIITLGPTLPQKTNVRYYIEHSIKKLLSGTTVRCSNVPYRKP